MLYLILAASMLMSIISLVGVLSISVTERVLDRVVFILVALSAGALMGGAFLHLIPEGIEFIGGVPFGLIFLTSFSAFFLMEKLLKWRHCHARACPVHTFAYMNLVGDAVHNFTDGILLAAAFMINTHLGITTVIAIAFHEIPQEIGDFGVLVYAGMKRRNALFLNFVVSLTTLLGAVVTYVIGKSIVGVVSYLLPVAAGSFVYIAGSDLLPELHKERRLKKSLLAFFVFLIGISIMWGLVYFK